MPAPREPVTIEQPPVTPAMVFDQVKDEALLHKDATMLFVENFAFFGKTVVAWGEELRIQRPHENIQPEQFRELHWQLIEKIQAAAHLYAIASLVYNAINSGTARKKNDIISALMQAYERRGMRKPAASLLEATAQAYLNDTTSVIIAAKNIKDFFKQKHDGLVEVRKCLEQIGISMHSEMKFLAHGA